MQTFGTIKTSSTPTRPPLHDRTRFLLDASVLPALLRLAAPNLGEAAARTTFIACDAVFVSWLGTEALAGVSLVFPLFLVVQMVSAAGIGAGVAAAIARAMGAGAHDKAQVLAAHAVILAVLLAAISAGLALAGGPSLYRGMGASGASLAAAILYSNLVFGGGVAVWLMNTLANVVRGTGTMTVPAAAIVAGEAVHLLISPLLILGWGPVPQLGVIGAAVGVLASYVVGSLILLAYLSGNRTPLRLIWRRSQIQTEHFRTILAVGGVNALTVIQIQATSFVATALVATLGTAALAGYGAATRLELLQLPLLFGLGSAMIAMIATNVGAGALARAQRIAWTGVALCTAIGLGFAVVALCWPEAWLRLFSADMAVVAAGTAYLRNVGPSYPALAFGLGLLFASLGVGQALRPFLAGTLRLAVVAIGGGAVIEIWAGEAVPGGLVGLFLAVAAGSVVFALAMLAAAGPVLRQGGHSDR